MEEQLHQWCRRAFDGPDQVQFSLVLWEPLGTACKSNQIIVEKSIYLLEFYKYFFVCEIKILRPLNEIGFHI
ncbi:hypothetical protein RUM44_008417 [Polyplax serrata]|uniref:Uncharacterized protein n=1 Tax=Polyplax serrata TaxID=468196 RepID=A0ABR1BD45_POLSC